LRTSSAQTLRSKSSPPANTYGPGCKNQGASSCQAGNRPADSELGVSFGDTNGRQQPKGDNARKGAVKKRTQLKNPLTKTSTKRNKEGGQFMAVKKTAKKFKGVRKEP